MYYRRKRRFIRRRRYRGRRKFYRKRRYGRRRYRRRGHLRRAGISRGFRYERGPQLRRPPLGGFGPQLSRPPLSPSDVINNWYSNSYLKMKSLDPKHSSILYKYLPPAVISAFGALGIYGAKSFYGYLNRVAYRNMPWLRTQMDIPPIYPYNNPNRGRFPSDIETGNSRYPLRSGGPAPMPFRLPNRMRRYKKYPPAHLNYHDYNVKDGFNIKPVGAVDKAGRPSHFLKYERFKDSHGHLRVNLVGKGMNKDFVYEVPEV